MRKSKSKWLEATATLVMLAIPYIGWPVLAFLSRNRSLVAGQKRLLVAVLVPAFALLLAGTIMSRGSPKYPMALVLLIAAILTVRPTRFAVRVSTTAFLLIIVPIAFLERQSNVSAWSPHPWQSNSGMRYTISNGLMQQLRSGPDTGSWMVRSWTTGEAALELNLSLDLLLLDGSPGDRWIAGDSKLAVHYEKEASGQRFVTIDGREKAGVFIYRAFEVPPLLESRSFRAVVTYRHKTNAPLNGGCAGVFFQYGVPPYTRYCIPLAPADEWTTVTAEWAAPVHATASSLRVGIEGAQGDVFDVRSLVLFESVNGVSTEVPVAEPTGIQIRLEIQEGDGEPVKVVANPAIQEIGVRDSIELRYAATSVPRGAIVRAIVSIEPGLSVDVSPARLNATGSKGRMVKTKSLVSAPRLSLWYGHPNLAAHTLTAVGLTSFTVISSSLSVLIFGLVGLINLWTGSRIAFWTVIAIGLGIIVLRKCRSGPKQMLRLAGILMVVSLALLPLLPPRLRFSTEVSQVSRSEIASVAVSAILTYPLGAPYPDFATYWVIEKGVSSGDVPQHAHNIWLDAAFHGGVVGGLGMLWLTIGIGAMLLRRRSLPALVAYGGLLVLNCVDSTLFSNATPFVLAVIINLPGAKDRDTWHEPYRPIDPTDRAG